MLSGSAFCCNVTAAVMLDANHQWLALHMQHIAAAFDASKSCFSTFLNLETVEPAGLVSSSVQGCPC